MYNKQERTIILITQLSYSQHIHICPVCLKAYYIRISKQLERQNKQTSPPSHKTVLSSRMNSNIKQFEVEQQSLLTYWKYVDAADQL